jgi:cytochrome b6-f complex iron-sulfur subunit
MTPVLALSNATIAAIVVVVVLDLFAIMFGLSFRRARVAERAAEAATQIGGGPVRPEVVSKAPKVITRRDFFRRSLITSLLTFGAQFGAASIAFMWPNLKGGFGSLIPAGKIEDIKAAIADAHGEPFYYGAGRFYIVAYDGKPTADVNYEELLVAAQGIMPLYQRCVHLGCRVPYCATSSWFECPCHGSKYNGAGEYQLGPAPRGMDRFKVTIDSSGSVMVDTSEIVLGPPRGTNTISLSHGPFCVPA